MLRKASFAVLIVAALILCVVIACADVASTSKTEAERYPNEYCCCTTETVDRQTKAVLDTLNRIVVRPYFRYFKVNIKRPCDYWTTSLLCTTAGNPCRVCRCDADQVPFGLKEERDMGCPSDEPGAEDGGLNRRVAPGLGTANLWKAFEELHADAEAEYVDLVANPEGFTGYSGPLANRIWSAVYAENCFSSNASSEDPAGGQCSEQLVFYQLLSGLHASISTHLSVRYLNSVDGTCGPNCPEFHRLVLDHPDRIDNLYTLYLFLLRAATRAADSFLSPASSYPQDQHGSEDSELRIALTELFHKELLCSSTFNETKVLETPAAKLLIPEMKRMMRNITTLMNCLTCEKCRLWGKVQTMGLATAFRVVMSAPDEPVVLSRSEKVTLMNFLRQVAYSVHSVATLCRNDGHEQSSDPILSASSANGEL